jgi:adenosine deaminase
MVSISPTAFSVPRVGKEAHSPLKFAVRETHPAPQPIRPNAPRFHPALARPYFGGTVCLNQDITALRRELVPLLQASPLGFPLAVLRSQFIETGAPEATTDYKALLQKFQLNNPTVWPTMLSNMVTNEAQAYLTSHIAALETLIANVPGRVPPNGTPKTPLLIQRGVEDAQALVRSGNSHLYGKHKTLIDDTLYQLMHDSPKVTLHEHQRGAAPVSLVRSGLINNKDARAMLDNNALQDELRIERLYSQDGQGPNYTPGLPKFLEKYNLIAKNAIKTPKEAYLGAYLYTLALAMENVRYFEYRFNPMTGGEPVRYAKIVQQGLDDAKQFLWDNRKQKIDANMVFSAYRMNMDYKYVAQDPKQSRQDRKKLAMAVLEATIHARKAGLRVTGFDLTGDEENFSILDYKGLGNTLKSYNRSVPRNRRIGATIHAGETAVSGRMSHPQQIISGAKSVEKAIEFFWDKETPLRLGHGIQVFQNPALLRRCIQLGIGFEQCPKSNVQTGAISFYPMLPTIEMLRKGALVSLSTDNRTLSKTTNTNEMVKLARYLGATQADRRQLQLNGIQTAFLFDPQMRKDIMREMQTAYQVLERQPANQRIMTQELEADTRSQLLMHNAS